MRPKINVLVKEDDLVKAVTREMTDEEYAEHLEMIRMAEAQNPAVELIEPFYTND